MTIHSIAISGASGWLGREAIAKISSFLSLGKMYLYSSNGRNINSGNKVSLPSENFLDIDPPSSLTGFVHLAFLTRDKVASSSFSEFVSTNLSLISKACTVIESSKPKWVVLVSSGAILDLTTGELETDILRNPYGFCKRVEESLILQSAQKVGANVVIGRLWGATGECMPQNSAYAISDFINSAHTQKRITINSGGSVFRRYVDAGEFIEVLIKAAIMGESTTVNSGGPKIEIGDLATLVSSHFSGVSIARSNKEEEVDDYFPRDQEFEELASKTGVQVSDLETQVFRTVKGHLASFCD